MKEKFILRSKLFGLRDKISVVHTPVDKKVFYFQKDHTLKAKFGILLNCKVLLSISRIVKDKGYLEMLEIFNRLLLVDKNYIWLVIGDGDYLRKLKC